MAVYSQGASPVLPIGNNALVGNFQASFTAGAAAGTSVTISVPLPTNPHPEGLYWIAVVNPAALGAAVTVQAKNVCTMADNNSYPVNVGSALTVSSGSSGSMVVQGFLLGDSASQIQVTLQAAAAAAGNVLIQVREV
ncbi:MAG: hypothetical protein ACPL5F_01420 [Moorellaceae bacterium]